MSLFPSNLNATSLHDLIHDGACDTALESACMTMSPSAHVSHATASWSSITPSS